jgi:serine/threonine protein kinase
LHAQGLMHGDLYAHNILRGAQGAALLGDFGAASFFAPDDVQQAQALQRMEVRAFACLLEELLERCPAAAAVPQVWEVLCGLATACSQEDVQQRPLFSEIEETLRGC